MERKIDIKDNSVSFVRLRRHQDTFSMDKFGAFLINSTRFSFPVCLSLNKELIFKRRQLNRDDDGR